MQSADAPSCGQKKHTRWPATNATCRCAIVRSEKTHTLAWNDCSARIRHRAVRRNTHAGRQRMQRADAPSCGQKKHTRWPATNGKCGCAIVRSEETHTLAGNDECNVLMRHRAVRRNTHAGRQPMEPADAPSCGQKKHTRWPATNATVPMRHRAVRKNTHAGKQPMEKADAPSCGQKKHTRWPATTGKCGCAIVWSGETHTLAGNECTCGCAIAHVNIQNQKKSSSSPSHILCNSSGVFPKVK